MILFSTWHRSEKGLRLSADMVTHNDDDHGINQLLSRPLAQRLLGCSANSGATPNVPLFTYGEWCQCLALRVGSFLDNSADRLISSHDVVGLGTTALQFFLQANITGPPLAWSAQDFFYDTGYLAAAKGNMEDLRNQLKSGLSVDGEAVYRLLPHVELFVFSRCLLNHSLLEPTRELLIWRLRVNTWHQRLLNDLSPTLQDIIYRDLSLINVDESAELLIERASIHILHGFDTKSREDLKSAAKKRNFDYVLTGRLGKRTRFQENELSQLVVLAKSHNRTDDSACQEKDTLKPNIVSPQALELKDDTLLDSIAFTDIPKATDGVGVDDALPPSLNSLDPTNQPSLQPLDSIILLATASAITNTSAQDGLTREETLPYAERVINGGSSNWQVYTQALLVRSRIEGYKSRTFERGVLQLQALVDQVIAETTPSASGDLNGTHTLRATDSTFIPRAQSEESAPASERLKYIHQLASPPRWKLEAELADRWVSLGGLRTALEIYERLQMWAEVALCWAASDREDKARTIIRRQLYTTANSTSDDGSLDEEDVLNADDYQIEKDTLPADAPRLFCILGDLERSPAAYERAWEISNYRFARAQRSLGKYYQAKGDTLHAEEAYMKSLKVNPQNHAIWFAVGCTRLQSEDWSSAADAFGRAVQIDDTDAESWSNLAVCLLRLSDLIASETRDEEKQKRVRDSFVALKRAASLKRDSFRIWQNMLSVSVKMVPPPYAEIIIAQTRLIELLGATEGEKCVDIPVMEALLADTIRKSQEMAGSSDLADELRPRVGLEKMVVDLIQKKIAPLIAASRRLWLLTAKLSLHLGRPLAALTAYEKAWRSQLNKPGWDAGITLESKGLWQEVAEATIDLIDAYESLGERSREAGMGEGEMVAKDWKFKARSAARSVLARAKEAWEDDEPYERLTRRLQDLKAP